jgi:hypothetical protein
VRSASCSTCSWCRDRRRRARPGRDRPGRGSSHSTWSSAFTYARASSCNRAAKKTWIIRSDTQSPSTTSRAVDFRRAVALLGCPLRLLGNADELAQQVDLLGAARLGALVGLHQPIAPVRPVLRAGLDDERDTPAKQHPHQRGHRDPDLRFHGAMHSRTPHPLDVGADITASVHCGPRPYQISTGGPHSAARTGYEGEATMDFWAALTGAVLGAITGGVATWLTTRQQMRRQLDFDYDRELRTQRLNSYKALYRYTQYMPRYWRHNPEVSAIADWSLSFHKWYFDESGGMFLTNAARIAYHDVLDTAAALYSTDDLDRQLTDEEVSRLWRAGQGLRRQLSADIGSADDPHLPGRPPDATPPARHRIRLAPAPPTRPLN